MRKKGRANQGQISLMVGMMLMTFLLFFAFVVNTGMLVSAKINLQNAADLAAYSGAATQARLLNQISYLNYEMRREYKKFLFRYYVLGNMAQDSFPRGPGEGKVPWSPGFDPDKSLGVPAVCMTFNERDNYCHLFEGIPKIEKPQATPLDQINTALINALTELERIKADNCKKIGKTNSMVLLTWLFNVDPTLEKLEASLSDNDLRGILGVVRGLGSGLGLFPRELILRLRIRTLASYVNTAPVTAFKKDQSDALLSSADPLKHERTLNAFLSAYNTLGNHTFPSDTIVMDELLPEGEDGARLLRLEDIMARFDVYSLDLDPGTQTAPGDCRPTMVPFLLPRTGVTIGVYKDPSVLTYYAIRLKAKAKVLFSPFGEMELKAYSAAQPFGSRIGPRLQPHEYLRDAVPNLNIDPAISVNLAGKVPNLAMLEQDSAATGKGWDSKQVAGAMFQALGGTQAIDQSHLQRAYQAAMAPNPWEASRYNILIDTSDDNMTRHYDAEGKASFYAPLFPPGTGANPSDELKQALDQLFPDFGAGQGAIKTSNLQDLRDQIHAGMGEYISRLMKGEGEGGEGFKIVHIRDPLHYRGLAAQNQGGAASAINAAGGVILTDPARIKSSWDAVSTDHDFRVGRIGYSVKFVSFDTLTKKNATTDGTTTWTNDLNGGGEGSQDIPLLHH